MTVIQLLKIGIDDRKCTHIEPNSVVAFIWIGFIFYQQTKFGCKRIMPRDDGVGTINSMAKRKEFD